MTNLSFNRAFVLKREHLEKLADAFASHIGEPNFDLQCSDQISRTFSDLQAVINYENPPRRRVLALTIRARSEDARNSASLSIDGSSLSMFSFHALGEENRVRNLKEAFEDQVAGMVPWYAWITRVNFVLLGCGAYVLAYGALLLSAVFSRSRSTAGPRPATTNPQADSIAILVVAGALGFLLSSGWVLNQVRNRFFPAATFAIGQGLDRYETQEKVRWGWIAAISASFVASVVYGVFGIRW